jgi:hypothetical protein
MKTVPFTTHLFVLLLFLAVPPPLVLASVSGGTPLWTNRYDGPANGHDYANTIAVDIRGNVFVAGVSTGSGGTYDYVTIAYSGMGVPLWTNRYDGPGHGEDYGNAVAVDGSGNVIVTGHSLGSGTSYDYATIKFSSGGVPLWTNRYNGPGNGPDAAYSMAVDGSGNVIVTGRSSGSGSHEDYATIKYSGAGLPLWTNRYDGPGNDNDGATAVALDGSGDVIVTGASIGSGSSRDYATIKYSSTGVPLWTNRFNGPGNGTDFGCAVAVDASSNIIVTGFSAGNGSGTDYATIKYSGAGLPLWTNRYDGPGNTYDYAYGLAVDSSRNIFVTGSSWSENSYDYATIAYSGTGLPLWTNRYSGPANGPDIGVGVTVDRSGNVFVTGQFLGTIAYSGAGLPLWTNRYDGPGNINETALVAVDSTGNVYVAGMSIGIGGNYDCVTIKYAALPPSPVLTGYTRLAGGCFQFGFTNLSGYTFTVQATSNVSLDASNWTVLGPVPEIAAGQFQFTDSTVTNATQRFYRVVIP